MGKMIALKASDGHSFGAYRAEPVGKPRAGLVVIQEIFGVNAHVKEVCDGFAADGYLAVAPAVFDRAERDFDVGYTAETIARGRAMRGKIDWNDMLKDVDAAAKSISGIGKTAIVGYCMGGTVTWLAATRLKFDCAVGYYGGGIHEFRGETPKCPTMLHFGEKDAGIPLDTVSQVAALHRYVPVHIYPAADHGFVCDHRSSFQAEATKLSRTRTLGFFTATVG